MTRELPEDFDVDYQLTRLLRRVRARSMASLTDIHPGLDYTTFLIFIAICDSTRGIQGSELAEQMSVHKSTISRSVAALERIGLVARAPHPDDGRAQLLTADAEGRRRLEDYRERSHAWLAGLIEDWKPRELAAFAAQLGRLNDAMETEADA